MLKNMYTKPGKGVKKTDVSSSFGFKRFFSTFADKFWKLSILNLLFFVVNCPLFALFAYLAGVGGVPYQTPVNVLFQPLYGVMRHGGSHALQSLYGVVGIQIEHHYPSAVTNALLWIGLLTLVTFGMASAAMTYVQRNFVRREPVDLAEDFFLCIKRNWKQSVLLGLFDIFFVFLIAFDLVSYVYSSRSFGMLVMLYATAFLSAIYLMMRPYMYLMCVTFDIKLTRIIKNAWILAVSGILRNLFFGVLALAVLALNAVMMMFIPSLGVGMLFIFTVSLAWFFQIYGAWPVVKKHMIDPYYEESAPVSSEDEAVFRDRG
ncbi:MAG: YesL family protein [Clostridia bacterium]|nr:YesL family protein [Clostridia bacterium]